MWDQSCDDKTYDAHGRSPAFQYILAKACLFYRNEDFPLEDAFKYFLLSAANRLPVAEFMVIFLLENGFGPQTPLGVHKLIKSEILKNPKVSRMVLGEFKECEVECPPERPYMC